MKKTNWDLVVAVMAGIGAVASLIVLIIVANSILTAGASTLKILGIIGLIIAFVMCCSIVGILVTNHRMNKELDNKVEIK